MSLESLEEIAAYIVEDGRGILAADESNPTCGKRFESIGVESTEDNRRDYREMLFRSEGMKGNIGGVILFDETIRQKAEDGTPLVNIITAQGALPGIKVDKGLKPLDDSPKETVTQGLDGLNERCSEYEKIGAKFAKWRAVINIGEGIPTEDCINQNMEALAKYAKIVQENKMALFNYLEEHGVNIKGTLLKPSMVISGKDAIEKAGVAEVAEKTLKCLIANVPSDLPGITFLSGGQSDIDATAHLNAMNKIGGFDWKLSFSYGRALQQPALKTWLGKKENAEAAQAALSHRALMNKKAAQGQWDQSLEK